MKKTPMASGQGARLLLAIALLLATQQARAAGPFTVNVTTDTHAVTPASSPNDSGGHISLRSAIEAANAQSGATTINLPAGTYNLTLGELGIAPNGNKTNTISGAGAATTIVNQTDPTNRVFNIDFNSVGRTLVTLSGITIQGGHDGADGLGGAGILAGSVTSTPKDVLNLGNCILQNNHCRTNTTQEPGGAVQMAAGDLNITGCTFSNNSSGQSFGGAIFVLAQSVISSLNVTNSTFANNSMTNNSGAGPNGGGAIMIETPAGSVHNIIGCTFNNNRVIGNSGNTYGGAIQLNVGTLNIGNSTFVTNSASGQGGLGGAIYADSGTVNLSFCRLVGNTATFGGGALYNHGSNGANTFATNNWWGCNGGPGSAGCDVVTSDGGSLAFNPWLIITNTASPSAISRGQSTALTASVLKNSNNQTLTAAQVPVLIGLPLVWNAGPHGFLSGAQTSVQANGQATATFTNDDTCNDGVPSVTLDNGVATANVTVQCPDLAITKTNNVSGAIVLGNNWTWTIHVANSGLAPASFSAGNTIALDNLPNANVTYGSPALANVSGVVGTLVPAIDGSANLSVTASGTVTLNVGGSFDVQFSATPTLTGTFGNPRNGGVCVVDPNSNVLESNEGNNSATNGVSVTCPAITGTMGGGGNTCPGGSAVVTVSVSGGTPPYNVTLNNGGGTQSGTGPFLFTVSPAVTTVYQISTGSDALGCPINNSGSSTVTISSLTSQPISLSPASVFANSAGNQASTPGGFANYAWTISNGIITGPTNLATITYVAGTSNNVVLGLTVFNASGCSASSTASAPIITGFSVHTNSTSTDALTGTTMSIAFDGTNYWSCSGGSSGGVRLGRYSLSGALVTTYSPGLDFRSLSTKADGTLLARAYDSGIIYQQASPGVFASSGITLTGGTLDAQSSVVLNGAGTEFNAMSGGVVSRWSTNGSYLGAVNLIGFGSIADENLFPQNRGLAVMGNLWLTYNGSGLLSIWDTSGNRITQIPLPGAGTSFDSDFGFSYCNGKVFIVDAAGGAWRKYDLFTGAAVAVLAAEDDVTWTADVTNKIIGAGLLPKVDLIPVSNSGNPVPTLAQLRAYQSVMVFSDYNFNDPVAMGNVLADYIDQGGGVALQTFVFANGAGYGIQGRLSTGGYLPFTTASVASPGNLTLVKDLPLHPLLDAVNSLNGGTSSFHNNSISLAAGATLVAHWSNSQPLVGAKDIPPGRSAGLNFFPPSSDVRNDLWVSSTDGARLMANALIWSGRIPPTILAGPANQVLPVGATANFQVTATGTSALGYQWRLNGTDLPSATNSTLTFTVQPGSTGAYSVVVSNLYGTTTSLNATLNPQLRFLSPTISGGTFSLFLVNTDGSPVATNRASRINIFASTNVALPISEWMLTTNTVVPSGAELRADGFSVSTNASRFFRAVETP